MNMLRLLAFATCLLSAPSLLAQIPADPSDVHLAPVVVDGEVLLQVRGLSAIPAEHRAKVVRDRLLAVADNPEIDPESGTAVPAGDNVEIRFGVDRVITLYPFDAALEGVPLDILARATLMRMKKTISDYRAARAPARLLRSTVILLGITILAALLIGACLSLLGWFGRRVEERTKGHIERLEKASHRVIHGGQVWSLIGGLVRATRLIAIVAIVMIWLSTALGLYPWTRPLAASIFHLVINPLQQLGSGFVKSIPDIAFLVVLAIVVRFILRAVKTLFLRVERGWVRLENFDREWAMPTYRIIRVLIIAFAVVVAYPYIPGSESDAFKGVGIFMGVVLSIGSTSFIANMIAGYSLTYRAAYREGDRVKIGEHTGEVIEIRALGTRLRSMKNEEINIPNSIVLASAVVNYSTFQRTEGLILHTEVGIGYDTPWRQVEALLKMAAARTEGLQDEPEPYVLQRSLGDFAVIYELNAYCRNSGAINATYSRLHGNIQDVFNEYGVQIMSPAYECDPEQPKLVRREDFHLAPAEAPTAGSKSDADAGTTC